MLQDKLTQFWVKRTGKRLQPGKEDWLKGPIGNTGIISLDYINQLAENQKLRLVNEESGAGLIEDFSLLALSDEERTTIHPGIVHFYEHTSDYNFEIWSNWMGLFKPFGKLLTLLFSKRLQQLHIPTNNLDFAKGVKSKIIKLKDQDQSIWTIWHRQIKDSGQVVYSGIYTVIQHPVLQQAALKIIFPLPNGNASVYMSRKIQQDGSLLLSSDGRKFGDNGFYFYLKDKNGKHWVKYVKSFHEWIRVYVDDENTVRAEHRLKLFGINFLNMHYKMTAK